MANRPSALANTGTPDILQYTAINGGGLLPRLRDWLWSRGDDEC